MAGATAITWPDPVPLVQPIVAQNPAVSSPEPVVGEPDADSVGAAPDATLNQPAPAVNFKLVVALLTAALLLAGTIARLIFQRFAVGPPRRIGLPMPSNQSPQGGRRGSAPRQSIVPILPNAASPGYFDHRVRALERKLATEREQRRGRRAEPADAPKQVDVHQDQVDPLEQLELLLQELTQREGRSAA
jgi:hypothetical protein